MAGFKYTYQDYDKENMARVVGTDINVSTKQSIEICNHLRKKPLQKAKVILEKVIAMKEPIPFKRFNKDMGHKKGMGPGRYPIKTSGEILKLLKSVETNAQAKGLNTGNLIILHMSAHQASRPMRSGRHRGRVMKRSHVEIVVEEGKLEIMAEKKRPEVKKEKPKAEKKPASPQVKKEAPKPEVRPEEKTEPKPEVKKEEIEPKSEQEVKKVGPESQSEKQDPVKEPAKEPAADDAAQKKTGEEVKK